MPIESKELKFIIPTSSQLAAYNEREAARKPLYDAWDNKEVKSVLFEPSYDSTRDFGKQMAEKISKIYQTITANKDKSKGVWYAEEYAKSDLKYINFLAHSKYFQLNNDQID